MLELPENDDFTASWGRRFIEHLGGDPSPIEDDWCWDEFYEEYGKDEELMKKVLVYFEEKECVEAAYEIARRMPKYQDWAEKIIKDAKNAPYAYLMVREHGSSREWAEKIIEKSGNAEYAYLIVRNCGSSREWAEKIIEKVGDADCAYWMNRNCGSSREWAKKIKSKSI